ncbi:MAG: hypothetical protein KBA30_00800 [Clostridia bacterium]|nr:hypothetical protein [Clostridia bacterium]
MIRYETFRKATRIALRVCAALMGVVLILGILVGVVFLRSGIRGVMRLPLLSGLIGIDRQVDLDVTPASRQEIDDLADRWGRDVKDIRPGTTTEKGAIDMSAGQFAYLLQEGGENPELFENVQVRLDETEGEAILSISTLTDAAAAAGTVGYTREDLDGVVGELPDQVAVLVELVLPDGSDAGRIELDSLRIGNIVLSDTLVDSANQYLMPTLETFFENQYGIVLDALEAGDQSIRIEGGLPAD